MEADGGRGLRDSMVQDKGREAVPKGVARRVSVLEALQGRKRESSGEHEVVIG